MDPIAGVDVDQNRADLAGGKLGDRPLGAVGRPDADPFPLGDAQGQQRSRTLIDHRFERAIAVAQPLVAGDQRFILWIARHNLVKEIANSHAQQRLLTGTTSIAAVGCGHRTPPCCHCSGAWHWSRPRCRSDRFVTSAAHLKPVIPSVFV